MAAESASDESVTLLRAPTWAIVLTCAAFIIVSLAIDRAIQWVYRNFAQKHNHGALIHAFKKMKDELFMVGILSLVLAMGQSTLSKICVSTSWYSLGQLCKHPFEEYTEVNIEETPATCPKGRIPFMTAESIHDLHILVFVLAVVHILYSIMIIAIGTLEVCRWRAWEATAAEKLEDEKLGSEDGLRLTHQTTFIRERAASKWSSKAIIAYGVAFFKQFYKWRVSETDYITLRSGFIKHHCASNPGFNFHKFILRSFQDDCKHIVGISWKLWAYAMLLLLIDINGWEAKFVVTLAPLLLVLVVGAVMQHILTKMANKIKDQHAVVIGIPAVMPDDNHFWHGGPRFILRCFHFILFQNALGTACAIWAAVTFPPHTCLYETPALLVSRIVIGVVVQGCCGLLILPVYILISQMGSRLKKTVFSKDVNSALSRWSVQAKRHDRKVEDDGSTNDLQHTVTPLEPVEGDSGISLPCHDVETVDNVGQSIRPL